MSQNHIMATQWAHNFETLPIVKERSAPSPSSDPDLNLILFENRNMFFKYALLLATLFAGPITSTSASALQTRLRGRLDNDRMASSRENDDMSKNDDDFDWELMPVAAFPKIAFDESDQGEVRFKYDYDGTLGDNKSLSTTLYRADCVTPADATALSFTSTTDTDKNVLTVDVDIITESIPKSVHYAPIDDVRAAISFCVRVDYNFIDNDGVVNSVNFHATTVSIDVDLTADFKLTEIALARDDADEETAEA